MYNLPLGAQAPPPLKVLWRQIILLDYLLSLNRALRNPVSTSLQNLENFNIYIHACTGVIENKLAATILGGLIKIWHMFRTCNNLMML